MEHSQPVITLSDYWIAKATEVGIARYEYAIAHNCQHYGCVEASPHLNIIGTITECAVAKYLSLPWKPNIGVIDDYDVGKIEVRGTARWWRLPIRPPDEDAPPYVFGRVNADNSVRLMGWLYGYEGKNNPARWHEPSQCWYNPPPFRAMEDLLRMVVK